VVNTAGGRAFKGKVFVTKQKMRMESPQGITITRMDKNIVWILMPQQQMYMEQPLTSSNIAATTEKMPGEIERQFMALEIIEGRMAKKYKIVYEYNGNRTAILQWIIQDLGIPAKTAAEDGSWTMEYKNIKMGKQSDVLFEVPAGYKKFSYGMGTSSFPTARMDEEGENQ
jgi:hypothetical protein